MTEPPTRGHSLRIDSDQELIDTASASGWSGNGSIMDPFIIEDLNISRNTEGACIYLGNTTLHVLIRNCTLTRSMFVVRKYGEGTGITVFSASNVTIMGCNASLNLIGIGIILSRYVKVKGSYLTWNYQYGIHVSLSDDISIEGCDVGSNDFGIYLTSSSNVTVAGCSCHDNDDHGVRLDNSHSCRVLSSTFEMNDDGVNLELGSSLNNISLNIMKDCRESAIAIGDSMKNEFHGNVMTNCSFYYPLEPLTVRYNSISRSNKVNGKDVLLIFDDRSSIIRSYDLEKVGQLLLTYSRNLKLSNMSASGGSQAVVISNSEELWFDNITISHQTFHAIIAYDSSYITLNDCSISDCYNGIEAAYLRRMNLTDVTVERTTSPLRFTSVKTLSMDRCAALDNENGISLREVRNASISCLRTRGCGSADIGSMNSDLSLDGCDIVSARTSLDLYGSKAVSIASSYETTSNSPIISAKGSSVTLENSTFRAAGVIKEPTLHPFRTDGVSHFVMNGNELEDFGLMPDQVFPVSGEPFHLGPGNKVNGRPLLYIEGSDMKGAVLSEPYGQVFIEDASDLHLTNQSFIGSCVGVAIRSSSKVAVSNSTFSGCIWGVSVMLSSDVNIRRCSFTGNRYGIDLLTKEGNLIDVVEGSSFTHNKVGCILEGGSWVKIMNNSFVQNMGNGITFVHGAFNVVYDNLFMDNLGRGVSIECGYGGNLIFRNAFIRNNGSGPELSISKQQAYDMGTNQWSRDGTGNFWYDLIGPDIDGDLIVDSPYHLQGGKAYDTSPLVRIPASILMPPTGIRVSPSKGSLVVGWDIRSGGRLRQTGSRLYLDRTLVWEGSLQAREAWLAPMDLSGGNITMTALSEFGEGEASPPVPLRGETGPPTLLWKNMDRNELSSLRDSLILLVQDPSGIIKVDCVVDGVPFISKDHPTNDLFLVPLGGLQEGPHEVKVSAWDLFWNKGTLTFDIIIDDSPPVISMELPGSWVSNARSMEIGYSITDAFGTVSRYEMALDGRNITMKGNSGTVQLTNLGEGEHVVTILGSDLAGNIGSSSLRFLTDLTPPRVTAYRPQGLSVGYDTRIEVETNEPLAENVSLAINGLGLEFVISGHTVQSGELHLQPLTDYKVTLSGGDLAGNDIVFEWMFRTGSGPVTPVKVMGRVVNVEGGPMPEVHIYADGSLATETGADGRFELRLLPGNHTLFFRLKGHRDRVLDVTVPQGPEMELGDIILERTPGQDGSYLAFYLLVLVGLTLLSVLGISVLVSAVRNRGRGRPEE